MTKKRKVEDSELEKVTGAGGIMDPPDATQKLAQVGDTGSGNQGFDTIDHDVSNDMIVTDGDRE